jgi:stage V sporulation protein G
MIINIVGPIAVGKSFFCDWFIKRHPEFVHASIDESRYQSGKEWEARNKTTIDKASELDAEERMSLEERAWELLYEVCESNENVILETSGLSWRIKDIFYDMDIVMNGIYTVKLLGNRDKIKARLKARTKHTTKYFPYTMEEDTAVDWMVDSMHRVPHNLVVDVDSGLDHEVVFQEAEKFILAAKLKFESMTLEERSNLFIQKEEEETMTLKVTDVKFFNVKGDKGKIKAYAAVTFNDELTVRGYKIVLGDNGLFVGKPSQLSTKDNKWYDNVNYTTEDLQSELHSAILERYKVENGGVKGTSDFNQTSREDDGVPF